jgi:hypothetical protein
MNDIRRVLLTRACTGSSKEAADIPGLLQGHPNRKAFAIPTPVIPPMASMFPVFLLHGVVMGYVLEDCTREPWSKER